MTDSILEATPKSEEEIKNILCQEGLVFQKKRGLQIPQISEEELRSWFNKDYELGKIIISALVKFLESPAISDNFATHDERQEFRKKLEKKYGKAVYDYYNTNQLRVNSLSKVLLALDLLLSNFNSDNNAEEVEKEKAKLNKLVNGGEIDGRKVEKYRSLSLEGKLQVVYSFEDAIIKILTLLKNGA